MDTCRVLSADHRFILGVAMNEEEKNISLERGEQVEDMRVTAGQRRINIIWEVTQAIIAISVTLSIIYVSVAQIESAVLTNAFFLIIGFYYSRTNHSAVGGVGEKPTNKYLGR